MPCLLPISWTSLLSEWHQRATESPASHPSIWMLGICSILIIKHYAVPPPPPCLPSLSPFCRNWEPPGPSAPPPSTSPPPPITASFSACLLAFLHIFVWRVPAQPSPQHLLKPHLQSLAHASLTLAAAEVELSLLGGPGQYQTGQTHFM